MSEWNSGYVTDIAYTHGYYQELNPVRLRLAFLNQGILFPEITSACELGFGQGVSINMHAAASFTQWHGTDFNPSQAAFARELGSSANSNINLRDDEFSKFAARDDLPEFDFIALHGIWSWINDENRKIIADFIGKKLKIGGVLYISYNTLPGWSSFAPARHLLSLSAQVNGSPSDGVLGRVEKALDFTEQLISSNSGYARAHPTVPDRLKKVRGQNKNYVAHEYFNRDWEPMYFSTMADWLQSSKVQYACSANYLEHVDVLNLTPEQQKLLGSISDVTLRETSRDFIVNQQFRRDYWVKGLRRLGTLEQVEMLRNQRVVLVTHRPDVKLLVTGILGEAKMSEEKYNPFLDLLADHKPRSIGQIERDLSAHGINFPQILQCVMVLISTGNIEPVQADDAQVSKYRKQTDKLNSHILQKSRGSADLACLASPLTGGGIAVGRFAQLFLISILQGKKLPAEWAQAAWELLRIQGQKLVKADKTLETPEENLAELTSQATVFSEKQLPILKSLMVI